LTSISLDSLGFTPELAAASAPFEREGLVPGRVVSGHQRLHRVASATGELLAEVAGSLRHSAGSPEDLPRRRLGGAPAARRRAAGADPGRPAATHRVRPPRRRRSHRGAVLAANIDTVFL